MPHLDLDHNGGMGNNMMNNMRGGMGGMPNMPFPMPDANFAAVMASGGMTPERIQEMMRNGGMQPGMEAAHLASMQAMYAHHMMMMLQAASASMGHQLPDGMMYQQQQGPYGMMQPGVLQQPLQQMQQVEIYICICINIYICICIYVYMYTYTISRTIIDE